MKTLCYYYILALVVYFSSPYGIRLDNQVVTGEGGEGYDTKYKLYNDRINIISFKDSSDNLGLLTIWGNFSYSDGKATGIATGMSNISLGFTSPEEYPLAEPDGWFAGNGWRLNLASNIDIENLYANPGVDLGVYSYFDIPGKTSAEAISQISAKLGSDVVSKTPDALRYFAAAGQFTLTPDTIVSPADANIIIPTLNSNVDVITSVDTPSPSPDPTTSPSPTPTQTPDLIIDPVTGINEVNLAIAGGKGNGRDGITDQFILSTSGTASPARISSFKAAEDFIIAPRSVLNNLESTSLKVIRQVLRPEGPLSKAESKSFKKELKIQKKDLKLIGRTGDGLFYDQQSGQLIADFNGKERGLGGGGVLAILEGSPEFNSNNLQIL